MLRYLVLLLFASSFFSRHYFWDLVGILLAAGFLAIAVIGFLYRDKTRATPKKAVKE